MPAAAPIKSFRPRSFVRRNSRKTAAQARAYQALFPLYGFASPSLPALFAGGEGINFQTIFGRDAPNLIEIGFGSGHSLLAAAKAFPDKNFLGVETHRPGIGSLLMGIKAEALTNLRVYEGDAFDLFAHLLPDASVDGVQIFFPDPWQKRKHHARRLIQNAFMNLMLAKCKQGASLHAATDWQDYAMHMMNVFSCTPQLINVVGEKQFAPRSLYRPIVTKFESRAKQEGRAVWELQFRKL